ncbi:MAG TPA: hypothetical protein PLL10_06260, partial [Elusimicrobiales bacterium]|nr:hypothetical protein [Elusimicrobiales bacterium]
MAELDKARADSGALEADLSVCAAQIEKNEGDVSLTREQLHSENLKENSLSGELSACESARVSLEETAGIIRQERARLQAQKEEKGSALAAAQNDLAAHKAARENIARALEELTSRRAAKQAEAAALKEAETRIQSSLNELRMRQVELESDRKNLVSERESIAVAAERRKAQREDYSARALAHDPLLVL